MVRYRSDLATSLNNLGVAFCRAGKSAEADAPFGRARDLLSTLADDYADEPAYRSSLAALSNNQALALAGAGRQSDALAIYPQAIEKQREASKRRPEMASMQEVLSKLYYNYGQSLGAVGAVRRLGCRRGSARGLAEKWRTVSRRRGGNGANDGRFPG